MLTPKSDTSFIYTLVDPRDDGIVYIGTSIRPSKRLTSICNGLHCGRALAAWARELQTAGLTPKLKVIEKVTTKSRRVHELKWIKHYLNQGYDLLNFDGVESCFSRWAR